MTIEKCARKFYSRYGWPQQAGLYHKSSATMGHTIEAMLKLKKKCGYKGNGIAPNGISSEPFIYKIKNKVDFACAVAQAQLTFKINATQ